MKFEIAGEIIHLLLWKGFEMKFQMKFHMQFPLKFLKKLHKKVNRKWHGYTVSSDVT